MLHACVERFDVMCVRGNILGWEGEVNEARFKAQVESCCPGSLVIIDHHTIADEIGFRRFFCLETLHRRVP
jgi:hypothetical protein